ncbi:hypothetical protein DYB32_003919 [Aphanomyces invadans]|uniref:Uncharacterized protein n=1 Tax=Aphanomyces invadans TaxID=157072 RepID=A0A3R6VYU3_9STRA|nr:hypothetical protein DYB32_003919 [Aphanomyces invadans]
MILLAHVVAAALHVVRVKCLVTAALLHRAEYIPTKRPRAFYERLMTWLCLHQGLVVVSHTYHSLLLYSFVQSRLFVVVYLVAVWVYSILAFPSLPFQRLVPKVHLRLASLACSLTLDIVPGISLRIWWIFACDDPIAHFDATDFATGIASTIPPILLLSALSSITALVTKFKPARSPQKIRRVTHGPSSPLRFDFTEPTKDSKPCGSLQRVCAVGSVVWSSVALSLAIHALHSHPSNMPGCVLVLRRPFTTVPQVCRSFELTCNNMSVQSLVDLPMPSTSLAALKFANCPTLALNTIDNIVWSALARLELHNSTVTAVGSATFPSLLHVVLRRTILSHGTFACASTSSNLDVEAAPALLPPSLVSLQLTSSRLYDDVLPALPQLRTLDLRHTPLRTFDGASMPRLVHVALLYAQLSAIDPWPAMNLEDLWLTGNPIESISDEILSLPRLQLLVVDYTKIDRVGDRVSTSLLRIVATGTPLCAGIADFLTHAQIQYTHGDTSLVVC